METTVTLQPPFEFSIWVLILGVVITVAAIALLIAAIVLIKRNMVFTWPKAKAKPPVYQPAPSSIIIDAKKRCSLQIQGIIRDYGQGKITRREGYQRLSLIIRGFVHDTTGINVENCTLLEIKRLGVPKLVNLIQEYYVPEFAEDGRGGNANLITSCNNAMGVIETWN